MSHIPLSDCVRPDKGFILPSFLFSPTGILAVVVVVLSISNVLFYKLWQGKIDDVNTLQVQINTERLQAKVDAESARVAADRVSMDISTTYSHALNNLRTAAPAVRVLHARSCVSDKDAGTSESVDGSGIKFEPDPPVVLTCEECEKVANNAVSDALQLTYLQEWILEQQDVNK